MIYYQNDYRDILRNELAVRCERNPRYSLRAFARDCDLSPSQLSEVLRGHHHLSPQSGARISENLNYSEDEKRYFLDLIQLHTGKSAALRRQAEIRLQRYRQDASVLQLAQDRFQLIADWYHLAILELMNLPSFTQCNNWIAEALDVSVAEVAAALERLERLGLVSWKGNKLELAASRTNTGDGTPSAAIKKFHHQILQKAGEALYSQSVDKRESCSVVLSLTTPQIAEVKTRIRQFKQDLCDELNKSPTRDEVYCLTIQLFGLSNLNAQLPISPAIADINDYQSPI